MTNSITKEEYDKLPVLSEVKISNPMPAQPQLCHISKKYKLVQLSTAVGDDVFLMEYKKVSDEPPEIDCTIVKRQLIQ